MKTLEQVNAARLSRMRRAFCQERARRYDLADRNYAAADRLDRVWCERMAAAVSQ